VNPSELAEHATLRWRLDPDFRMEVTRLRDRQEYLLFTFAEVGATDDEDDELRDIEERLDVLGVPASWQPETEED
jgi:hypothetical protein